MFKSLSSRAVRVCSRNNRLPAQSLFQQLSSLQSDGLSHNPCPVVQRIVRAPDNFVAPVPKPLMVADGNYKGALTALLAAVVRLTSGIFVSGWQPRAKCRGVWPGTLGVLRDGSSALEQYLRPTNVLVLFENEADPHSRLVREACSILDLNIEFVPIFTANTAGVILHDGDLSLTGSRAIIEHLFTAYGPGTKKIPFSLTECWGLTSLSSKCATRLRGSAGGSLSSCALSEQVRGQLQPIILWGFEGSPFVRPVREALCALGLRHRLVSCARGSQNRDKLFALTGRFQAPYLQDPNTGVDMFESGDIVKYLNATYSVHSDSLTSSAAQTAAATSNAVPSMQSAPSA